MATESDNISMKLGEIFIGPDISPYMYVMLCAGSDFVDHSCYVL